MIDLKIIGGLLAFTGLVSAPAWLGHGKGQPPELKRAAAGTQCVEKTEFMRARHMELLDTWRNAVVRDGQRVYVASDGRHHDMSLTGTCLGCHGAAADFCDRCHQYSGVEAYCWDCHQKQKGGAP